MVQVMLVDADNGLGRALRATTWDHAFASAVLAAIERQVRAASPNQAQAEIQRWHARYPDTPRLVAAADIHSAGGR